MANKSDLTHFVSRAPPALERFLHTPDGRTFVDLVIDQSRETWPVRSDRFRMYLDRLYFNKTGRAPRAKELRSSINLCDDFARYEAAEQHVSLRVGSANGKLYLDLADEKGRVVEISSAGWWIPPISPVPFERLPAMRALPVPARGGSLDLLRSLINVAEDDSFTLMLAWLLDAFRNQ